MGVCGAPRYFVSDQKTFKAARESAWKQLNEEERAKKEEESARVAKKREKERKASIAKTRMSLRSKSVPAPAEEERGEQEEVDSTVSRKQAYILSYDDGLVFGDKDDADYVSKNPELMKKVDQDHDSIKEHFKEFLDNSDAKNIAECRSAIVDEDPLLLVPMYVSALNPQIKDDGMMGYAGLYAILAHG